MIHANNLSKKFDDFLAVDKASFDVNAGQVMVLLGPNGAGKTTTVRMLTSILRPTSGTATVAGYSIIDHPAEVRARVGVLTEHHGLYKRMNAQEYLDFFGQLYGVPASHFVARRDQLLEQFGLTDAKKKRLGEYSKGMRQKLALSRALIHEPNVLLLDEPTSAMDPESARMVRDAILKLRSQDRAIILCTHNLAEAEELADKIAIIRKGKILFFDDVPALKEKLVGPPEYIVKLSESAPNYQYTKNHCVQLTSISDYELKFQVENPEKDAPQLLRNLSDAGLQIKEFMQVHHSLEAAYLEAIREVQVNQESLS